MDIFARLSKQDHTSAADGAWQVRTLPALSLTNNNTNMKKYLVTVWSHTRSDYAPGEGYTRDDELLSCIERFTADSLQEIKRCIAERFLLSYQPDPQKLDINADAEIPGSYTLMAAYRDSAEDYIEDVYFNVAYTEPCADLLK